MFLLFTLVSSTTLVRRTWSKHWYKDYGFYNMPPPPNVYQQGTTFVQPIVYPQQNVVMPANNMIQPNNVVLANGQPTSTIVLANGQPTSTVVLANGQGNLVQNGQTSIIQNVETITKTIFVDSKTSSDVKTVTVLQKSQPSLDFKGDTILIQNDKIISIPTKVINNLNDLFTTNSALPVSFTGKTSSSITPSNSLIQPIQPNLNEMNTGENLGQNGAKLSVAQDNQTPIVDKAAPPVTQEMLSNTEISSLQPQKPSLESPVEFSSSSTETSNSKQESPTETAASVSMQPETPSLEVSVTTSTSTEISNSKQESPTETAASVSLQPETPSLEVSATTSTEPSPVNADSNQTAPISLDTNLNSVNTDTIVMNQIDPVFEKTSD